MKNFQNRLFVIFLIAISFSFLGYSQDNTTKELTFDVERTYTPLSISKAKLDNANTLEDLNRHYETSWVKEYISVQILTIHNGETKKAMSKSDILTEEQKELMAIADVNTEITVNVQYLPDNILEDKDIKKNDFSFLVYPESEATYLDGKEQLKLYLKEKAIDKIPEGIFINYGMAAIKFTVNEDGEINNVHIFESSKDEKVDKLLVHTIENMPCWKPAEYANGVKVKQEFALIVGNMENCMINLLNINKGVLARND